MNESIKMTWKEAAVEVLTDYGYPMHAEAIVEQIFDRNLKTTDGETPTQTLRTEIYRSCVGHEHVKDHIGTNIFFEDENGNFGLCSWSENSILQSLDNNAALRNSTKTQDYKPESEDEKILQEENDEDVFVEGRELYALHKVKERNQTLINSVKEKKYIQNPELPCEICGFSFKTAYGALGLGFIEAHHTKPLSELDGEAVTNPEDIILICSNCHKMIHRKRPWLSIEEIQNLLKKKTI